jgi:hypothetical protein
MPVLLVVIMSARFIVNYIMKNLTKIKESSPSA